MGTANITSNFILFVAMIDAFIYLLARSWQLHISGVQTSAAEDKIIYAVLITALMKSLIYLGLMVGIDNPYFSGMIYLTDLGLLVIALVLGMMAHDKYKSRKRGLV